MPMREALLPRWRAVGHPQAAPQQPVRGDHALDLALSHAAAKTRPRAFHDQPAGRNIPQADAALYIGVESSGGHISRAMAAAPIMRTFRMR